MGLDQYLTKKVYVGANYEFRNVTGVIDLKTGDEPILVDLSKVSYIEERVGYWRKANHIHNWFVENVQDGEDDCGEYYVSEVNMEDLLSVVNKVLADHALAPELLPTQRGFFFGGTEYDEYYFSDLEETKTILEEALKSSGDFYYSSSW